MGATVPVVVAVIIAATAIALTGAPADPTEDLAPTTEGASTSSTSPDGAVCYTGMAAFEPSIGSTSDGTLFMQASWEDLVGEKVQAHQTQGVVRSSGDCGTWDEVTPGVLTDDAKVTTPPAGFDPLVYVDDDADRVFSLNMQGLQCNYLSFSDDGGDIWLQNPVACGQPAGLVDHPTLWTGAPRTVADQAALDAVGYPNVVYLCVNRIADTACARSLNGGATFGAFRPLTFRTPGQNGDSCFIGGLTHHGVSGPDGRIYLGKVNSCTDEPLVAMSEDDGINWQVSQVAPAENVYGHDVVLAVDEGGNVYAHWIDRSDRRPRLAVSTDHGATWSAPIDFAPSEVDTSSFPALSAGADGRIAIGYYGAADNNPSGSDPWNGYLTVSTDATSSSPTFQTTTVNDPADPIARGACNDSNRCPSHDPHEPTWPIVGFSPPGPGDFIDMTIDDDGRPWVAMVDMCNASCVNGNEKVGHRAFAGTLSSGPALTGPSGPLPALS